MYDEFNWNKQGNTITLTKGNYILERNMIIPKNLILNIDPGVQILIDKDKSIISYSPINIIGTENEPIIIKNLDENNPFGTFGIIGDKSQKSVINWLRLSGGNEKFINGIYFSGGLSIYYMHVDIDNTIISDNHADDGLNIKYSNILIDNSLFVNNFADQVDLDFAKGVVKNSQFKSEKENIGDGIDFSGSDILIKNNTFEGLGDKGISIGERTKVILYKNKMINNNMGAAVKDSSYAFFIENLFENNEIAISHYKKKPIYENGGSSYLHDNKYVSNVEKYKLDETSQKKDIKPNKEIQNQILNEDLNNLFETFNQFITENITENDK